MNEINRDQPRRQTLDGSSSSPQSVNVESISDNQHGLINNELELKYGAEHVIKLYIPVSLCMLLVVFTINNVEFYTTKGIYLLYTPFHEESNEIVTKAWNSVANSLILMAVVIVMTMLLIVLYTARCYRVIFAWLFLSSMMLLFIFSYLYLMEMFVAFNIPLDFISLAVILWNFGMVGMISVHSDGPIRLQQMYLIFIAALMALVFIKYLPEVTTWVVLAVMSIWDLYAVLTPRGPLRVLVETAQRRNEPIFPSLIYSSNIMTIEAREQNEEKTEVTEDGFSSEWVDRGVTIRDPVDNINLSMNNSQDRPQYIVENQEVIEDDEKGVKLGLGDFIFYSVLVGKASSYGDWNIPIACYVAILIGLALTLILLAIFRKALPALPISITLGLIFYFATRELVKPFVDLLATEQIFIALIKSASIFIIELTLTLFYKHMSQNSNFKNQDCFERINFLYQASNQIVEHQSESNQAEAVSNYYANLMRNIAKKSVLRIGVEIKRKICKKCNTLLVPGVNCRVRIRQKPTKNVRWTCLKCLKVKRFNFQSNQN